MNRFGHKLVAVLALLALLVTSFGSSVSAQGQGSFVSGEILVKFVPGATGQTIAAVHRQNGGQTESVIPGIDTQVVRVPAGHEAAAVARYQRNPNVVYAEPNGFYTAIAATNDLSVGSQWQYNNMGQTGGTPGADIEAFAAWSLTSGNGGVAIAILDTGIDQSHEDLAAKIAKNKNFTSSSTVDDKYGHGTHVAGSAAAITNNAKGVAGTCPNCVLYNVKVLDDRGSGAWSWVASGITWAADNGAKVISMSLGGSSGSSTVESAINYAWNKGVVVVVAAGNDGSSAPSYPAYYGNAIAVAATDAKDAKASWSNYGSWVDVAAPGVSILSTAPDHRNRIWRKVVKYGTISGTSMATPHVAGIAGLVWSSGICTDNSCVRGRIESTAEQIGGEGTLWTHGRVNAYRSVTP